MSFAAKNIFKCNWCVKIIPASKYRFCSNICLKKFNVMSAENNVRNRGFAPVVRKTVVLVQKPPQVPKRVRRMWDKRKCLECEILLSSEFNKGNNRYFCSDCLESGKLTRQGLVTGLQLL